VTFLEILLFAEQTASALEYVVSKGFVHMDVAARNALLHTNNLVKLSDFGIVRDSRCFIVRKCVCVCVCVCVATTCPGCFPPMLSLLSQLSHCVILRFIND